MTWSELTDGVFAKHYDSIDLNVGVVVCEGGVLVIDTRAHHRQARELIQDIKYVSSLPIGWVINTHHHWDHTFGNGEFFDAEIWGHELCARHLADHGQSMLERIKGILFEDEELTAAGAFDEVVLVPPRHTFSDSASPEFGGRLVEMSHLGRGHTDNDIVIRIDGVTFAGDLIEEGAPPSYGDAYPLEWAGTVGRLLYAADGPIVPGHGAVVDAAFARSQRADIAEVAALARERHADGLTVSAAAAAGGPFPESTLEAAFTRAWQHLERQ
jgi:glyoxylase-like metal-dependent hydrolase (beta-lactamase superfamily II)